MGKLLRYLFDAFIALMVVLCILPFGMMLVTSLQKTTTLDFKISWDKFTLDNYIHLFSAQGLGKALLTSTIVTLLAIVMNVLICVLAAYGFAFKKFPGSEKIFWIYLLTLMVPGQVTMIPLFLMFKKMGILGELFLLGHPLYRGIWRVPYSPVHVLGTEIPAGGGEN